MSSGVSFLDGSSSEEEEKVRGKTDGEAAGVERDGERRRRRHKRKRRRRREREEIGTEGDEEGPASDGEKERPTLVRDRERRESHGMAWMTIPTAAKPKTPVEVEPEAVKEKKEDASASVGLRNMGGEGGGAKQRGSGPPGDGGASWRLKAMRRAAERAEREGRSVSDVVEERFGSDLKASSASGRGQNARSGGSPSGGAVVSGAPNSQLSWRRGRESGEGAGSVARRNAESIVQAEKPADDLVAARSASGGSSRKMADLLRARLKGSTAGVKASGSAGSSDAGGPRGQQRVREVILPKVSLSGRLISQESAREAAPGDPSGRFKSHGEDGKRVSYFADDDVDLKTLVREQKFGDARGVDELIESHISKRKSFNAAHLGVDEEYDNDGALRVLGRTSEKRRKKSSGGGSDSRQKQVQAFQRAERSQEHCRYCLSNPNRPKQLVVAIGQMSYLRLPTGKRSVAQGHCLIVPMEHLPSTRVADDNTLVDIRNFKKSLMQMFGSMNYGVVFTELGGKRGHVCVEAVPVPLNRMASVPMLFKHEFAQRSDELNSEFHSKHLIETGPRGIQEKIPEGFPYFWVEFGLGKGYLHAIDGDPESYRGLGGTVLQSLLNKSGTRAVEDFKKKYEAFDWTVNLQQ
ncbi:hypothetical protein HOP50_20g85510 [Chloropicon primus]|uniref:Uncharacterized protein n=1 Tax=Chloropicon primus TaxID=1764295 RepID=A0A5B8N2B0_9CHLO|nr:hypothetical protein A3770_20p85180 [Chloropicon primus]UPR05201.1 hypothetical protein HOP50_20g85510 [Chloropicon primus]|eukprot:QDZ26000.1 hypothetical protein A3770_20p85180 [Chloropicon primus]